MDTTRSHNVGFPATACSGRAVGYLWNRNERTLWVRQQNKNSEVDSIDWSYIAR